MSRSRKKPVIKQQYKNGKKSSRYWRTVRRVIKGRVRYLNEELEDKTLPAPKEIINDYDYSDYTCDLRFGGDEMSKKESRK
jgi:hypothetical protein